MPNTKLEKASRISGIALPILYLPMSFFSFLFAMVSELTIGATDPVFVALVKTASYVFLAIPLLCVLCLVLAARWRKKGKLAPALGTQFLPLVIFLLNLAFTFCVDAIYF